MLLETSLSTSTRIAVRAGALDERASQPQAVEAIDVAILVLPEFPLGEFAQIVDIMTLAKQEEPTVCLHWQVYGIQEGRVASSAGIEIPCRACTSLDRTGQTLIIVGPRPRDPVAWARVAQAVRLWHLRGGTILGVGDAVEVLTLLGLLKGRRACAHWQAVRALREQRGDVDFSERLFVVNDRIGTCAGASATADLMLDFVSRLTRQAVADRLADRLNCEKRRTGQNFQRHAVPVRFGAPNQAFVSAIDEIQRTESCEFDLSRIAAAAGVSSRQLQRLFRRYLKRTPTQHFMTHRLEQAKELLTRTQMSVIEVAIATGFTSPSHFSLRYAKAFGISPSADRGAP
jgi:transcriptional regulator GlxA family with amidase domain